MSLADTPHRRTVRVTGIRHSNPLAFRLMEMGFIRGAEVQVVRCAPLGDPLQVRVGDYDISVRSEEAALIDVA